MKQGCFNGITYRAETVYSIGCSGIWKTLMKPLSFAKP